MDAVILNWTDPLTGLNHRQQFSLPLRIGRRSSNDLILCDSQVSRCHAELRSSEGRIVVADLASANGTYLDNRRLSNTEVPLADGSILRIGATNLLCTGMIASELQAIEVGTPAIPVFNTTSSITPHFETDDPALQAETVPSPNWQPMRLGGGYLAAIAWAPDGSMIAVASSLGIALREARTFEEICQCACEQPIRQLAFSPDGQMLLATTASSIFCYRIISWRLELQYRLNSPGIVTLGPVGGLFMRDTHTNVEVIDGSNLECTLRIPISTAAGERSITCSPDQQWLAIIAESGLHIWHIPSKSAHSIIPVEAAGIFGLAFSNTGDMLAIAYRQRIVLWNVQKNRKRTELNNVFSSSKLIAFSPDNSNIIVISAGKAIFWDISKENFVSEIDHSVKTLSSAAFEPYTNRVALISQEELFIWNHSYNTMQQFRIGQDHILSTACNSSGEIAAACGNTVRLWQPNQTDPSHTLNFAERVEEVSFESSGELLRITHSKGVELWDVANAMRMDTFAGVPLSAGGAIVLRKEAQHYWIVPNAPGTPYLQYLAAAAGYLPPLERACWVAAQPDADIVGLVYDNMVSIYTLSTGHLLQHIVTAGIINAITFDDTGKTLIIALQHEIQVWNTGEQQPFSVLRQGAELVQIAPNASLLAAVCGSAILLWDLASGALLDRLPGHADRITALAFSPDAQTLVSGSYDGTVRTWPLDAYEASG